MQEKFKAIKIRSDFHGTQITVLVPKWVSESLDYSPMQGLRWLADRGDKRAQRQVKKIEKAICGMADCSCGGR